MAFILRRRPTLTQVHDENPVAWIVQFQNVRQEERNIS